MLAAEISCPRKRAHILSPAPSYAGSISPRAALRAIEAALRSQGDWRPIETAPFQGMGFLACSAEDYDTIEWLVWQSKEDEKHKFFNMNSGNYTNAKHWTHWRPLPAPPGALASPVDGESN